MNKEENLKYYPKKYAILLHIGILVNKELKAKLYLCLAYVSAVENHIVTAEMNKYLVCTNGKFTVQNEIPKEENYYLMYLLM